MRIFFSVGEPSGDLHGANLIRDIKSRRPLIECVGYGGPRMRDAGCEIEEDLTRHAVMGILPVLLQIVTFWRLLRKVKRYFQEHHVDAVVLIDYPGFNWWVARKAKAEGIPVFYYGAPQMWGWGAWRVRKMRRLVDHVLCKLPFEEDWYGQRGCNATYVGHPYFDEMERQTLNAEFVAKQEADDRPLVTILPGSRRQEVVRNLPTFLKAAELVQQNVVNARFVVACFNEEQAMLARPMIHDANVKVDLYVNRTPELIHSSECCMACSGSVSLELLFHTKPTVIHYQISRLQYVLQALIRKVKFITLVNLLATPSIYSTSRKPFDPDAPNAERVPFPEYLTQVDKSDWISAHIVEWLTNDEEYQRRVDQLTELKARYGHAGASERAAEYVVQELDELALIRGESSAAA